MTSPCRYRSLSSPSCLAFRPLIASCFAAGLGICSTTPGSRSTTLGAAVRAGLGAGPAQVAAAEVEQLDQGVVGGEVPARLADLAEPVVDALEHVRGVDHFADLGWKPEERDHLLPGGQPLPADPRVRAADLGVGPAVQRVPGGLLGRRL